MVGGGTMSATNSSGIRGGIKKCSHIQFNDGQHRSCNAKKNNILELYFDELGSSDSKCQSCLLEKEESQRQEEILEYLKIRKYSIDEDMHFYITDYKL